MRNKIKSAALLAVLVVTASIAARAYAVSTTAEPDGAPDADEVRATAHAEYEARFGGMLEMSVATTAGAVEMPEVKTGVPDWVRDQVPGNELASIYCAMAKWRTGEFLTSLKAVKDNVGQLVALAKDAGVIIEAPDLDSRLAEGDERIIQICGTHDLETAESLGNDFQEWAAGDVRGELEYFRLTMISEIEKAADGLREQLRSTVEGLVEKERAAAEAEVRVYATQLADNAARDFKARTELPTQSEVDVVKAQIESQVRSMAEEKRQSIEDKVQRAAAEILLDRPVKFQRLGAAAGGLADRIAADAAKGAAGYEKYRDEARTLRKALVLETVEDRIVTGIGELTDHADDIELAKQYDATLKGVPEFKAELLEGKQTLLAEIGSAIDADDDTALQLALQEYQDKWEGYRKQVGEASSKALGQACETAVVRLDEAKPKLAESREKAQQTLARCEGSDLEECIEVARFAPRLNSFVTKLDDLLFEIGEVDRACADPSDEGKSALGALLEKVKVDGAAARAFGESLNADHGVAISNSVRAHCNTILPEIRTILIEVEDEDLGTMRNWLSRCGSESLDDAATYCEGIDAVMDEYRDAESSVAGYRRDYEAMRARCALGGSEDEYPVIAASLRMLREDGEALRETVALLRSSFGSQVSRAAFCRSARQVAFEIKSALGQNDKALSDAVAGCEGKSLPPCDKLEERRPEISDMESGIAALSERATQLIGSCGDDGVTADSPTPASLLADIAVLHADVSRMSEENRDLIRRIGEAAPTEAAGRIWLEAESAGSQVRSVGTAPNVREISPDWRPPYFGNGVWLLSSEGQYMEIGFKVPADGKYAVWVRDLSVEGTGPRNALLAVDGKAFGRFSENSVGAAVPEPGLFGWHRVAIVELVSGSHVLRVTKGDGDPVVLDAFYLTVGEERPADKSR